MIDQDVSPGNSSSKSLTVMVVFVGVTGDGVGGLVGSEVSALVGCVCHYK